MTTSIAPTVLALDIGGSKTHAVLAHGDETVAEAVVGSANVSSVGVGEAGRQLDEAIRRVGGPTGILAVCAGAAGVDTPGSEAQLRTLLAERLPCARVRVVHDSQIILAAAGVCNGIALISGTGSVAWGRDGQRSARAGAIFSATRAVATGWPAKRFAEPSTGSTPAPPQANSVR